MWLHWFSHPFTPLLCLLSCTLVVQLYFFHLKEIVRHMSHSEGKNFVFVKLLGHIKNTTLVEGRLQAR